MTNVDLERRRRHLDALKIGHRDLPATDALPPLAPEGREAGRRCDRLVRPDTVAPLELDDPTAAWTDSPIRRAAAGPVNDLASLAQREDYVAAITDGSGRIIWSTAGHSMRRHAERANFVRGANWSEAMAGTNAPGLVLRTGRPASVFATEHWCESVSDWVCYAAPIRDVTGRVLGVVDLSADWRQAHPLALTTISSIARLIEHELAANPGLTRPELAITAMGEPTVRLDGVPVGLTRRQVEILTLLALHPDGLTLVELQEQLFGDRPLSPATVKAEVSRLRASIGRGIGSRPYRITLAYHLDASTALDALGRDDLETALRLYRGPLLPTSDSPALTQLRHHIDVALGDGLRRAGTAEQKRRFATRQPYGHRLDQGAGASWSTRQL